MKKSKQKVAVLNISNKLNRENYRTIWNRINELAFVMQVNEYFLPIAFIDCNNKTKNQLGYSKEEFFGISPLDIIDFYKNKTDENIYEKLMHKRHNNIQLILQAKNGRYLYVEANLIPFISEKNTYILVIATDITKNIKLEKQINGIIKGIPDVVKIFDSEHKIILLNQGGQEFYNKSLKQAKGKKCYELLEGGQKCKNCAFDLVLKIKRMVNQEKYIPQLNKFMDVCYNPVLDEFGEILFVVERMTDITEKKMLDKILKDSKERYKQIITNAPNAILIIVDNKIVLANNETCSLVNVEYSELIGTSIYNYFPQKYKKIIHKKFNSIISEKKQKEVYEYNYKSSSDKSYSLQITCSHITYEGSNAVLIVINDITEMKRELNKAAEFQKKTLQKDFPLKDKVEILSTYKPSETISGDSYKIYKVGESCVLGMLFDVRGKGITAALNISAFEVLFLQEISITQEPVDIIKNLNTKLISFYDENYIAACCFSMDFDTKEFKISGAGINQFLYQKKDELVEEKIIAGPFLGMFENIEFEQQIIKFSSEDKIILFTDGLDFILDEDRIIEHFIEGSSINNIKDYMDELLDDISLEIGKLIDDSTMLAMKIK